MKKTDADRITKIVQYQMQKAPGVVQASGVPMQEGYLFYLLLLSSSAFGSLITNVLNRKGSPTTPIFEWMRLVNQLLESDGLQLKVQVIHKTGDDGEN